MERAREDLAQTDFAKRWADVVCKRAGIKNAAYPFGVFLKLIDEEEPQLSERVTKAISDELARFAYEKFEARHVLAEEHFLNSIAEALRAALFDEKKNLIALSVHFANRFPNEIPGILENVYEETLADRVGMLYTINIHEGTKDTTYELVQLFHKPSFKKVARELQNCLDNKAWREHIQSMDQDTGRGNYEILVLRTGRPMLNVRVGSGDLKYRERHHALAAMQYFPKRGLLRNIEGAKTQTKRSVFVPFAINDAAFKPMCAVVHTMQKGEVPGIKLLRRVSSFDHATSGDPSNTVLLASGEKSTFARAPLEEIISIDYARIKPDMNFDMLQKACRHARVLDMRDATAEQRDSVTTVWGSLIDEGTETIRYENLRDVHENITVTAKKIDFPWLEQTGFFDEKGEFSIKANEIAAPRWKYAYGKIRIPETARMDAPGLFADPNITVDRI